MPSSDVEPVTSRTPPASISVTVIEGEPVKPAAVVAVVAVVALPAVDA